MTARAHCSVQWGTPVTWGDEENPLGIMGENLLIIYILSQLFYCLCHKNTR